ncbi:MAG: helix-turn-helix domain-containing protein [Suipraeoptans sp.]
MRYLEYVENQKHGTADFPLAFYHLSPTHPRYEMSYHWHIECELIRILLGELLLDIDNVTLTAKAGDVIYIEGGALHGGVPDNCAYECIVFHREDLLLGNRTSEKLLQKLDQNTVKIQHFFGNEYPDTKKIVWDMFDKYRERREGYELAIIGQIYKFYANVLEHHYYTHSFNMTKQNTRQIRQLKDALKLIESSYNNNISLKELAKAAQMSEKYFCKFFKSMTHKTPIDYLNNYRIERACFELSATDNSVTEIALNCGFNDISYFISTFKKYKGTTPKKYLSYTFDSNQ